MRKTIEVEGGMQFRFDDFLSAEAVDVQAEKDNARLKFNGASIVDIIAENDEQLCFIEAKNFVHLSEDSEVQASMDKVRGDSYAEIADAPAYAKRMLNKLEHSLFIWLASGNSIQKPVAYVLAFHVSADFDGNLRRILIDRLNKYIPNRNFNPLLCRGNAKTSVYFDMPEAFDKYGFSVTIQRQ